ncbi:MAG TPA: c-type cytochrome [Noviherbaspirillum sp.]|uniref:cytochrome c n=1 Tax=Noviherbaspirillum sp. TaxID=1926288 RepID=UPI002B479A1F|nr:c-type cytochrome [Noviherbaspirillum sp.]HJV84268.1 c-type cytochrome [Noviherbaspirillum sp.]
MIQDINQADAQLREHPDPHESGTPVPRTVIAVVSLALLWAVGYIFMAHPSADPSLGDSRTSKELMAQAGGGAGAVDGAQIFGAQCAACHQASGSGVPGVFPPLAGSEWVNGKDSLAANILLHGISGKLTVKGQAYQGAMPAFGDKLSDAQIAAVLSHVRTQFGNSAGKVDEAAVKAARESTKGRTTPWTGDDELAKLK